MDSYSTPGDGMAREIKARFTHGKIEPLEKLDLAEGEEVTILVGKPAYDPEAFRAMLKRTAGGWAGLLDVDAYLEDLYQSRHNSAPPVNLDK
jgi:predicted DNA-binding antitoxin AbrB/MazE fold protein